MLIIIMLIIMLITIIRIPIDITVDGIIAVFNAEQPWNARSPYFNNNKRMSL